MSSRTGKLWIEYRQNQVLMRMLKSRGGLAHGRGVTTSTQSKMVHIIPQTVPICDSVEVFSGVHSNATDQHKDLRPTSTARDGIRYTRFKDYLAQHSPFIYKGEYMDNLVCISTGIVAPATANADGAIELGELTASANQLTGKNYTDVKLKRNDKVTYIGVATNGAEVRGCQVENAFLGNHKNKSRFIFALIASLTHSYIKCP